MRFWIWGLRNHLYLTKDGWKRLRDNGVEEEIAVAESILEA
jgi:hypothetical protein